MSKIIYKGKVKVDLYRGDKCYKSLTFHNNGTSELFRYMANCMVGNYNQSLMPRYIHTFVVSDDDINTATGNVEYRDKLWDVAASTAALNVPFSSVQVREGAGGTSVEREYVAEYTFLIPAAQLSPRSYNDITNAVANVICLYNNVWDNNNTLTPLAYIILRANTFSTTATYRVGEYVIYNDKYYVCTTAVTNPGDFNNANWEETTNPVITLDSNTTNVLITWELSILNQEA